jgi:hypothetical protein
MKNKARPMFVAAVALSLVAGLLVAQDFGRRRRGGWGGGGGGWGGARDGGYVPGQPPPRNGIPEWEVDPGFRSDVFTFVRIQYDSYGGGRRGGGGWWIDYPDSDLNFPFRLQQLTSMKVDPVPKVVRLTDDALFDYPFVYMIEPGSLRFSEEEVVALRRYLLNGGFMMVDDFWGDYEWENFHDEIKRVFPDRDYVELELDHPIFHCVYDLKKKPQVPSIGWADHGDPSITTDRPYDDDARDVHYRAFFDDKGRMMTVICHNTDLGDGWEREGLSEAYFHEFSEKWSYPMGVNIVFYAMTH